MEQNSVDDMSIGVGDDVGEGGVPPLRDGIVDPPPNVPDFSSPGAGAVGHPTGEAARILDAPPPYVSLYSAPAETPLAAGQRHIARALEALRSGSSVQMKLAPDEHAACVEYFAQLTPSDISNDLMGAFRPDLEVVRKLLAGETVQAGG